MIRFYLHHPAIHQWARRWLGGLVNRFPGLMNVRVVHNQFNNVGLALMIQKAMKLEEPRFTETKEVIRRRYGISPDFFLTEARP